MPYIVCLGTKACITIMPGLGTPDISESVIDETYRT